MHVAVDAGGGEDEVLAADGVGAGAGAEGGSNALHHVGVTGFAYTGNLAVFDTHVSFYHAQQGVEDGNVGDNGVEAAVFACNGVCQAHAVAQRLAAAVYGFVAQRAEVFLYLHIQLGVGQTYLIAHGGAEKHIVLIS